MQRSIAVFPYRATEPRFLLLKRVAAKGGFWQPVTGRVESGDALTGSRARYRDVIAGVRRAPGAADFTERENLLVAALREVEEELGAGEVLTVVDLGLEAHFQGLDGVHYSERSFAAEVPDETGVVLSDEHEDARWCSFEEALGLLEWEENRQALRLLQQFLDAGEGASVDDKGTAA